MALFIKDKRTPLTINGKAAALLTELMQRPVPCPSLTRRSSYAHRLRSLGIRIRTEWRAGVGARTGIYHLVSRVRRATAAEQKAFEKAIEKAVK